jgi:hypothetical protein
MLSSGAVELVDGLHRWAVADELGIAAVPMTMEPQAESSWAWTLYSAEGERDSPAAGAGS